MPGLHKHLLTAGAVLALGMASAATPASAIPLPTADGYYSLDGGTTWVQVGGCAVSAASNPECGSTFTAGGFAINVDIATNAPGTASESDTTNSSAHITNNNTESARILFLAGGTGFVLPTGNFLWDATSITSTTGSGGSISTFACLREDDTFTSTLGCTGADFTTSTESLDPIPATGAHALTTGTILTNTVSTPYALIDVLDITLTAGEKITFNSSAQEILVPEPASLAIFGTALLGFGLMRRRRRNS